MKAVVLKKLGDFASLTEAFRRVKCNWLIDLLN